METANTRLKAPECNADIHCMEKSLWTPDCHTHMWLSLIPLGPFSAVIITSTHLGRLSNKFWSVAVRMCTHASTGALMMSGTDWARSGVHSAFQLNPKVFSAIKVTGLWRSFKIFHTSLVKPCLHGPCFGAP